MPTDLFHVSSGPQDGPTLLLLHPLGSRHEFWDECVALLAPRFRVIACDLRGAGQSPIPDRPWRLEDHVSDLIALHEHLRLDDVIPIGCATGSLIAAAYAAAEADRVRALVLTNTTPRLGPESRQRQEARVALVQREGIEALLPKVADLAFQGQPRDARYERYVAMYRCNDRQGFTALALGMIGSDVSDALRGLTCPGLVVAGGHDTLLPSELGREAHALLPASEFVILESAGHFAPFQAPERFVSLVCDFLHRRCDLAPTGSPTGRA